MGSRKEFLLKKEARLNALKYRKGLKHEERDLNMISLFFFRFVKNPELDENGNFIKPTDKEMISFVREFNNNQNTIE